MQEDKNSITKPDIIAAHLGRLQREHHLVKIHISGTTNTFNSMLISVDAAKKTMLLDVLHPDIAHQEIIKKKNFTFNVIQDGLQISFKGNIKKLVENNGELAYFIDFPNTLFYQQRRQAFRAPISKDTLLSISLTDMESNKSCNGIINNISRDGLCLQINHNEHYDFKKFRRLSSQFIITSEEEIICDVEVRNIIPDLVHRHTRVGVQFKDLNKQQQKHIQNYALQIERQMIKRKRT